MDLPAPLTLAPITGLSVCFCFSAAHGLAWVALDEGVPIAWDGWYHSDSFVPLPLNEVLPPAGDPAELAALQRTQLATIADITLFPLFDATPLVSFLRVRAVNPSWSASTVPLDLFAGSSLVGLLLLS